MADHDDEGRDAGDSCKRLCSDANQRDMLTLDCVIPRLDHCDLLLDAIDQQLDQLQVKSPKPKHHVVCKTQNAKNAANTQIFCDVSVTPKEIKSGLDIILRGKEETKPYRDQVIKRLERLLGEACKEGKIAGEARPLSDSICTEDFVRCFTEEMVDLSPFKNVDQLNIEDMSERTEISDSDTNQNWQSSERTGSETSDTVMSHRFQSNKSDPRKEDRTFLFDSCGENASQDHEKAGAGVRNKTPQRPGDHGSGVAAWSFNSMSPDRDLVTDGNEQLRQQVRWTGRCSFVTDADDLNNSRMDHSDNDTAAEEDSEAQSTAVRRFSDGRPQKKSLSVFSNHNRQKNNRLLFSLSDNKHSNKDINHCIRMSSPGKTSETWLSDCTMKEEVFDLQHKCEKMEKKLRLRWIQLKDVELCLSELRQKKKQAIQRLELLSADTAQMLKEKRTLEFALRRSRFQIQQLQRQRESCMENGFCWNRSCVKMSVLECDEMDGQLDLAKPELFAERCRSREKIESLQEQLGEVHEALHMATEAGSSLLNRCACLQKQMEKRHHSEESLDVQVSKPQHEVEECRIRVGTQDKMLAQKELQLAGLQEKCETLQTERDNLKRKLQHLKSQHCRELEEAQEKAHAVMQQQLSIQRQQIEEAKHQALNSLRTCLIQEHTEELCSLKCVHWTEGGTAASLCRQRKARDLELRRLQMSMALEGHTSENCFCHQTFAIPQVQDKADKVQECIHD
ncbi:hypothetical protein CHARACLAT_015156 [Characodon lateralis]|uniref:Uncharacterized protein n=1 Tax=Characodon lateralis TaxID=208331 RepID=A0ABU7DKS3_9TELE|nr:hypothetical protein [Characodon lateralis]